ncbi:MAG: metallophosphoesterase family protein [Candidatus Thorarchaeota archaeon]
MKFGIISDTHITTNYNKSKISLLINQLENVFKDVDKIVHAGDICEEFFLDQLNKVAPVYAVKGNLDNVEGLDVFIDFKLGKYKIGVIHNLPTDLENFVKINKLNILIFGHTHQPLIKGMESVLLLNPGSPTEPKAPPEKKGFLKPIARPTVMTLNVDENNILSTYIIHLKK